MIFGQYDIIDQEFTEYQGMKRKCDWALYAGTEREQSEDSSAFSVDNEISHSFKII